MFTTLPLFGAIPGGPEMLIILLVLVLLFGANKIPKLARSTGQAMGEFKKGREQVEEELQEMQEGELDEDDEEFVADADSTVADTDSTVAETETETDTERN
ncbi:twin-arginine translocase TatA/TatE family subunit [Halobaculum sp. CBA1158]|uniref:Sec-independent protein translocase subunit TatA/TatB n=1 Tax=Halobaculum sp. CBA1158 TaxID=2904243 RepID=UPI001F3B7C58|nr:twin-arginine translocase TatA/TatE family subunit [Halobaculum sp. CBA1158]UIO98510.1 twin-arginine translocase TatA/TatE family subunit [Halobaculum sp. CBA1158]